MFVTKYRRTVFTKNMIDDLKSIHPGPEQRGFTA
ncbi:hypothetical protein [Gilliamella sp. BG4]